jgi:hypothetical protein
MLFGAGFSYPSLLGGFELFLLFFFSCSRSSFTSPVNITTISSRSRNRSINFSGSVLISSLWASLPLFMHMAVSAFFGLAMFRFRDFLYRRTPFFIIQGGGVVALCSMWLWPSYWVCFSMLCLLGIYAGFVYYCAVYYASNSGRRSFNTGINEALVGFGSIAGIVLGDAWMRHSGSPTEMYLVCGVGLAVSVVAQMTIVFVNRKHGVLLPVSSGSSE